ncbi:alpha-1,6- mannosyltransferase [Pleosporales sp. CAS-2024a]
MPVLTWPFYALIPTLILIHLSVSPYTKVEESFNIQAIHDILVHGIPTENADEFLTANFDHVSFPGSVPRTFAGAVVLSGLSRPFLWLLGNMEQVQLLVRGILGLLNAAALIAFGQSVQKAFGTSAGVWYALFQASQFHVMYYASRTLPNMFALLFSNLALRSILMVSLMPWHGAKGYRLSLYLLTVAGIVFRSELAVLVYTLTVYLFATQKVSMTGVILPAGLGGLVVGLLCTVPLDSFMWQSFPLWPEWVAFYYNTIQGHSADWGVSPWHYYFANSLPRLLLNPATFMICIPVAVLNFSTRQRSLDLLVPLLAFVAIYSFLPHKEWRFIIYVIPGLTGVAAAGASWIWNRRTKSITYAALSLAMIASIVASFAASLGLLALSSLNYPGGVALDILHHNMQHAAHGHFNVHFDNLACQTGVTRFLENHGGAQTVGDVLEMQDTLANGVWTYDKTEDASLLLDPMFWAKFDYVLAERPEKVIGSWAVAHVVYGFGGVRMVQPGEASGSLAEPVYTGTGNGTLVSSVPTSWTDSVAQIWKGLEGVARQKFLRGYWAEVKMEPKIYILVNPSAMQ